MYKKLLKSFFKNSSAVTALEYGLAAAILAAAALVMNDTNDDIRQYMFCTSIGEAATTGTLGPNGTPC